MMSGAQNLWPCSQSVQLSAYLGNLLCVNVKSMSDCRLEQDDVSWTPQEYWEDVLHSSHYRRQFTLQAKPQQGGVKSMLRTVTHGIGYVLSLPKTANSAVEAERALAAQADMAWERAEAGPRGEP